MKVLKIILFLLGVLAAGVFIVEKVPRLRNGAVHHAEIYGDLYGMAKVYRFKPLSQLPQGDIPTDSVTTENTTPADASILFVGDSFGFEGWADLNFEEQLARATGAKIFSIYNNLHSDIAHRPLPFLQKFLPNNRSPRFLIFEQVERLLPDTFAGGQPVILLRTNAMAAAGVAGFWNWMNNVVFEKNTELRYEFLLKNSIVTFPVIEAWNSAVFAAFHQISSDTPLYSLNPPFLFYKADVASFTEIHSEKEINLMADHLAAFARILQNEFNCTLVFLPVPDKITVYSRLATKLPYDNFLPRLCAAARARQVCTVELLPRFKNESNLLYWPTDTHWNNTAIQIAVEETMKNWPSAKLPITR